MDKEAMEKIGMDVAGALERFMGNEVLYIKFLKKFLDDKNYENLKKYMEEENIEEAFRCAHTLKGLGANLGMEQLYRCISPLVEMLRSGTMEGAAKVMEQVTDEYEKIVRLIQTM